MLNGKGMVNFSEGYFLQAVWLGIGDLCDGEGFVEFFRRVNIRRYHSIESVCSWDSLS